MQLKHKTCWVFDLDGTLTEPVHDFGHIRSEIGIAPEEDILEAIENRPAEQKRTMLARLDKLERHYAALAQPATGVSALLALLKDRQCRLGILTRNRRDLALLSLQAIGVAEYFAAEDVLGRDEILPKPAPDGINFLLNQWGSCCSEGVMVGDFHFDLLSGRAAGVVTVHVDSRDRHWPDDTDYRISDLNGLIQLLE